MVVLTSMDSALVLDECCCAVEGHMIYEKEEILIKLILSFRTITSYGFLQPGLCLTLIAANHSDLILWNKHLI